MAKLAIPATKPEARNSPDLIELVETNPNLELQKFKTCFEHSNLGL
jgi:hypothetical protein